MFDEIALLEEAGHHVAHFSTSHPENVSSPWEHYFVPYLELGGTGDLSKGQRARAAIRVFANREATKRFRNLLNEFRPEVIHVHGIHRQLSPSILFVAKRKAIPVVQTLHDYHHVCPCDVLLKSGIEPCQPKACGKYWYGPAVANRCVRRKLSVSALSAAETGFQRIRRTYERCISRFISPSRFLVRQMREGGWRETPIDIVPNAVRAECEPRRPENFVLYCGRLSVEKGIPVLLEAARRAGVELRVAGDGPLSGELRETPTTRILGRVDDFELKSQMSRARAVVVPSVCFENAPMSVLEAMAAGVPVIASRIGGIPELIEDEVEGVLVSPGDVAALTNAIVRLARDEELAARMGQAGRLRVEAEFSPQKHLERLLSTYSRGLTSRPRSRRLA